MKGSEHSWGIAVREWRKAMVIEGRELGRWQMKDK
jgi:hypothetical protein